MARKKRLPVVNAFVPCLGLTVRKGAIHLMGVSSYLIVPRAPIRIRRVYGFLRLLDSPPGAAEAAFSLHDPQGDLLFRVIDRLPRPDRLNIVEHYMLKEDVTLPVEGTYTIGLGWNGQALQEVPFTLTVDPEMP